MRTYKQLIHEPSSFGYIPVTKNESRIFYWLFRQRTQLNTDPLYFWVAGGPGYQSSASFSYNGPLYATATSSTKRNNNSDNNYANMVYIDFPLGAGFSYTVKDDSFAKDRHQYKAQFKIFMEEFFRENPEFEGRDVYIGSTSYGGHLVGYEIEVLLDWIDQEKETGEPMPFKFKGVTLQNPAINEKTLYSNVVDYAYYDIRKYYKMNHDQYIQLKKMEEKCVNMIDNLTPETSKNTMMYCRNVLDQSTLGRYQWLNFSNPPYKRNHFNQDFFMSEEVEKALKYDKVENKNQERAGVNWVLRKKWWATDYWYNLDHVYSRAFEYASDDSNDFRILIYCGDKDLFVNHKSMHKQFLNFIWKYKKRFVNAPFKKCKYGKCKQIKSITYVVFQRSLTGHKADVDKEGATDLVSQFIRKNQVS